MEFQGIKIDLLGLSQIYLNRDKIIAVKKWFDPKKILNLYPFAISAMEYIPLRMDTQEHLSLIKMAFHHYRLCMITMKS